MSLPAVLKQKLLALFGNTGVSSETPDDGALAYDAVDGLLFRSGGTWVEFFTTPFGDNNIRVGAGFCEVSYTNDAAGTAVKKFCILTAIGTVKTALMSSTGGVQGVVVSGAGTSGNPSVAIGGIATVTFDGSATAGHYVQLSATNAGEGHDAGATYPTSGQVLGIVIGLVSGSDYSIAVFGPEIRGDADVSATRAIAYCFDGNGAALTATQSVAFRVPYACTIASWSINAKSSDSGPTATIKVWKIASGTASPSVANSINTSGVQLTTGTAVTSTTLSDFTTLAIAAGDYVVIQLSAVANATQIGFTLGVTET